MSAAGCLGGQPFGCEFCLFAFATSASDCDCSSNSMTPSRLEAARDCTVCVHTSSLIAGPSALLTISWFWRFGAMD